MPNPKTKILCVDDEAEFIRVLQMSLAAEGFQVLAASSGAEALRVARREQPDLIILDIMMPGQDGWTICQTLRQTVDAPIMMLTAEYMNAADKARGLELGADDYMTKPFDRGEFIARIHALLRRNRLGYKARDRVFLDGALAIDLERHMVKRGRRAVRLTQREWSVLECLLEHQGRVVTSEQLLRRAWGPEFVGEKDHLKVVVNHLRQKLGDRARSSRYIHTERGLGYCFDPDLKAARPPT